MFGIGHFAQVAQVSVRTLRHYGDVGLLIPAAVDPITGYRSYSADQLPALNRILVLKDLGFTLAEIGELIERGVSNDELVAMLRVRQLDAQRTAEAEQRRLAHMAARIEILTGVPEMSDSDAAVVVKSLDPVRVAVCSVPADGFDVDFAPLFAELYPQLFAELDRLNVVPAGPTYGLYDARSDDRIDVMAGVVVAPEVEIDSEVVSVRDLPPAERAATLVHTGSMATVMNSFALLDGWIAAAGETAQTFGREVYHECPPGDQSDWVTELQFVLT